MRFRNTPSPKEQLMSFKLKFNCPENWDQMSDCGTNRFCQNCKQSVHDLSLVDEEEAIALVQGPEDTCVRFSVNKAGQVLTRTGFSTALIFSSSLSLSNQCNALGFYVQLLSNTRVFKHFLLKPQHCCSESLRRP